MEPGSTKTLAGLLGSTNVVEFQNLKAKLEKFVAAIQERQLQAAYHLDQIMSRAHDKYPDVYQEFQVNMAAKSKRNVSMKSNIPSKLHERSVGKSKSSKKSAFNKVGSGKRRTSSTSASSESPSKDGKKAKSITTQKRGNKQTDHLPVNKSSLESPQSVERQKKPEHNFWKLVDEHFEVPTQKNIDELLSLREEMSSALTESFTMPSPDFTHPSHASKPDHIPNIAFQCPNISSLRPSTFGLRVLSTLFPDQHQCTKPCLFDSDPFIHEEVTFAKKMSSTSKREGLLCDVSSNTKEYDQTLFEHLRALGALVDSDSDDEYSEAGNDQYQHRLSPSSFDEPSLNGQNGTGSMSSTKQNVAHIESPSIFPSDEVTEALLKAQTELGIQEEVASDCLYTLYNTITKSDIEVEHRRVRQEADICELLTQLEGLYGKCQTYSIKHLPIPKSLKEQIKSLLRQFHHVLILTKGSKSRARRNITSAEGDNLKSTYAQIALPCVHSAKE
eukprot:gene290-3660_t